MRKFKRVDTQCIQITSYTALANIRIQYKMYFREDHTLAKISLGASVICTVHPWLSLI